MNRKLIIFLLCACLTENLFAQKSLKYSEFQEKVISYSKTIKQSEARFKAMQKSMELSKTAFLPGFDASGSYQYRINDYSMDFGGVAIPMKNSSYSAEVGFAQPIYAGGTITNNYQAAKLQSMIADKSIDLTKDNIIYSSQLSYWGSAAQKEMYKRMCEYVEIISDLTEKLRDKYELGQISKTDLIQMQARLKDAELQRSNSLLKFKLALQNMNSMMGEKPLSELEIADSISTVLYSPLKVNDETVLNNRPDLSISLLEVDYQKRQVNLAEAKYNPTLSVGMKGSWGTQLLNIDGSTTLNSNIYASLKVPLFHWGARFKSRSTQKALLMGKEFALQEKRDNILKEVSSSWTSMQESIKQIEIAKENCKLAEENLDLNTFSYEEGKLTILDVLSAQLTWIQATTNLIQAEYNNKVAIADYEKSTAIRYYSKD